jgi:hypothetical protein
MGAEAGTRDELKAARKARKAERKQKKAQKKQARADKKAAKKNGKADSEADPLALLVACEDDALEALMQSQFAHVPGITVARLRMMRDLVRAANEGARAGDEAARARLAEAHAALLAPPKQSS